jgi:hypothetical protein
MAGSSRSAVIEHQAAVMSVVAQVRAQVLCSSHISVLDLCQDEGSFVAPLRDFYQCGINTNMHFSKQFGVDEVTHVRGGGSVFVIDND